MFVSTPLKRGWRLVWIVKDEQATLGGQNMQTFFLVPGPLSTFGVFPKNYNFYSFIDVTYVYAEFTQAGC